MRPPRWRRVCPATAPPPVNWTCTPPTAGVPRERKAYKRNIKPTHKEVACDCIFGLPSHSSTTGKLDLYAANCRWDSMPPGVHFPPWLSLSAPVHRNSEVITPLAITTVLCSRKTPCPCAGCCGRRGRGCRIHFRALSRRSQDKWGVSDPDSWGVSYPDIRKTVALFAGCCGRRGRRWRTPRRQSSTGWPWTCGPASPGRPPLPRWLQARQWSSGKELVRRSTGRQHSFERGISRIRCVCRWGRTAQL